MSLRFFIDHCVPDSIIRALRGAGHEVLRLRDFIPCNSPDSVVIGKAQELDCILVSLNGDFADIITYPPSEYKGVIALQIKNHPEIIPLLMETLTAYLSRHSDAGYYSAKLFIVEVHRIRIRE